MSVSDLTTSVQQLLDQRQSHADALARIDAALGQIQSAIQGLNGFSRKPGRPVASAPKAAPKARRRGRGVYAQTGEELILSHVRQYRNPTTSDLNGIWLKEGRAGKADMILTKLVKERKLKRQKVAGERGSRYLLP